MRIDDLTISDSEKILRHFETKTPVGLDAALTELQHAQRIMLYRLLNGSIYQLMVAERWLDPRVYPTFAESFRSAIMPRALDPLWPVARGALARRVRGRYVKSIDHLSDADRMALATENFLALDRTLGEQQFLFGDSPTSADSYLFAYLYAFLATPFESPIGQMIRRSHPRLVRFYDRVSEIAIGDVM